MSPWEEAQQCRTMATVLETHETLLADAMAKGEMTAELREELVLLRRRLRDFAPVLRNVEQSILARDRAMAA